MTLQLAIDESFVYDYSIFKKIVSELPEGGFYYKGIVIPYNSNQVYRLKVSTSNIGSKIKLYSYDGNNFKKHLSTIIAVKTTTIFRVKLSEGFHRLIMTYESTDGRVIEESNTIKVQVARYATVIAAMADILFSKQNDYMIEYQRINGRIGLARFEMLLEEDILQKFNSDNSTKYAGIRKVIKSLTNQASFTSVIEFISAIAGNTVILKELEDKADVEMGSDLLKTESEFFSSSQIHTWERESHSTRRDAFASLIHNFSKENSGTRFNLKKATNLQVELTHLDS